MPSPVPSSVRLFSLAVLLAERLAMLDRDDAELAPHTLLMWFLMKELTVPDLRALLLAVWTKAEFPSRTLETHYWLQMFRDVGFVTDDARKLLAPSRTPLTVWRGARPRHRKGMSWTLDIDEARWHARRELTDFRHDDAAVFRAKVPRQHVLAILLHGSTASEVVVDPRALRGSAEPRMVAAAA